MSKFTNQHGLPEPLFRALSSDKYSKGDARVSVTTLLGSPQVAILKERHRGEIQVDVMERLWSLFGTTVHTILEEGSAGLPDYIAEERIFTEIDGWRVSGGVDVQHLSEGTVGLRDWKVTSAYAVQNGKPEWEEQLNCYAYLIEKEKGLKVRDIQIGAIIRDWKRSEMSRYPNYPSAPMVMLDIPLWSFEEREAFIKERVRLHKEAQRMADWGEELPECTAHEMWEKPTVWAVMKKGGVKALSIHNSFEEASSVLKSDAYEVIERPGGRTKCEGFCEVSRFCAQHARFMEGKR